MISIIYSTNRVEPKFDWFIKSLINQTTEEERKDIEIIFVKYSPLEKDCEIISEEYNFGNVAIVSPKANLYQGYERKTKTEYFSPSNARNTGFIFSSGDYVVFIDDVSLLMPGWWNAVKEAYKNKIIVCGSYQKHWEMVVEDGKLVSSRSEKNGIDSRWRQGNDKGPVLIQGSQMFGCSFGIPAEAFIKVNGLDEICDSIGGEDYHLGIRLNNAGYRIHYDRRMFSVESEELHDQPYKMLRDDRVLPQEKYMSVLLNKFGVSKRHIMGNWDSSHMILDILYGKNQIKTIGNEYDISFCREQKRLPNIPDATHHWFDDKLLIEL